MMEEYVIKNQQKLRCGITTGTCAAAAAKAAASWLLLKKKEREILIHTPKGIRVSVPVHQELEREAEAEFFVVKDSGDDPDVTNGTRIYAGVKRVLEREACSPKAFRDERYPGLFLDGGEGVGRVTQKGLEQSVGQAAINQTPRAMIFQAVEEVRELSGEECSLLITVRVPEGEQLAKRTFNPRLGIEGGISILGTSGILEPMSEKAIVDTIETQIRQLRAMGVEHLLVTPGNYGQGYAQTYLGLSMEESVKCSNYIGDTLDFAISYGIKTFLLVGNVGKLVKLAAGIMNTHSKVADARGEIMAAHAALCGADRALVGKIMDCINTEEMLTLLEEQKLRDAVLAGILERIEMHMGHRAGGRLDFGVALFSERYGWIGQTREVERLLPLYRKQR